MTVPVRVSPAWLSLREPADAAARAPDLVEQLRPQLPAIGPAVIHDLGCGTGAMGRWLAPQLAGPQHWILHDWDADLLGEAATNPPASAADGGAVSIETRQGDLTSLQPGELAGASVITASALLDLMTVAEIDLFVARTAAVRCPVLLTLSVSGRVALTPPDPLDHYLAEAFNDHQRRTTGDRRLAGPDGAQAAAEAFLRLGAEVLVRPSPWRLTATDASLAVEWLVGWVDAACEQCIELGDAGIDYARRRAAQAAAGTLLVTVHHLDLLACF
jgi:trans-aconitate methyltransferase